MLRHLTAACLAALLALNVVAHRSSAKPPDLPDDDPIIVAVPESVGSPAVSGAYLFTIDPLVEIGREAEPERIGTMPVCESPCPYKPASADRRTLTEADAKAMPTVMGNLSALKKAAREIDRARKLGVAGKMTEAIKHLDKARKLCPGSSYAQRADEVMNELLEAKTETGAAEEQEKPSCPDGGCTQLTRIQNAGACCMSQIASYCEKVQATAAQHAGCCPKVSDIAGRSVSLKFDRTPLARVAGELTTILGVPVELDPLAFQMRGLSVQMPITVYIENLPVTAALDILCRPLGLEAQVSAEAIRITSPVVTSCGTGCCTRGYPTACESACPKCEKMDSGLTGSIVLNERNFDCEKGCPKACETACPKCEKMHQEVVKKAAGVAEQVDGLMKACYLAIGEGRNAKAADLARQAHALDPKRVEADPLVYKLHMLAEESQCEECETPASRPTCPACPKNPVEENISLRPALPAVDPDVVVALDRVLTVRYIGGDGLERIGVDFGPDGAEQRCEETKKACCPRCETATAIAIVCLCNFSGLPPWAVRIVLTIC